MEWTQRFEPSSESVTRARWLARTAAAEIECDPETIGLLVSELAGNAVLHARSSFEVRIEANSGIVRVEVINDEPELLIALREPDETGGRGLRIIDALADRWGMEANAAHKTIWCELVVKAERAYSGGLLRQRPEAL